MPQTSPATDAVAIEPEALTPKQAATFIGTTEGTLAQWRHHGEGPPFVRLNRRKIVYLVADLRDYLVARREVA